MANIWEKAISILAGNLNLGRSYLITTVSENLRNFENLKEKKSQNSVLYSIQWPPDNWPGALGLVPNKDTKLGK